MKIEEWVGGGFRSMRIGGGNSRDDNKTNALTAVPYHAEQDTSDDSWGVQLTQELESGPSTQVWYHHDEILKFAAGLIAIVAQQEEMSSK